MSKIDKLELIVNNTENEYSGYVYMPNHPGKGTKGASAKQIDIYSVIKNYKGPDIYFDFDDKGELIGIEILGNDAD